MPLYVAVSRGLSLADLDFVLGGSALDFLANRSAVDNEGGSKKYLAQRVHKRFFHSEMVGVHHRLCGARLPI